MGVESPTAIERERAVSQAIIEPNGEQPDERIEPDPPLPQYHSGGQVAMPSVRSETLHASCDMQIDKLRGELTDTQFSYTTTAEDLKKLQDEYADTDHDRNRLRQENEELIAKSGELSKMLERMNKTLAQRNAQVESLKGLLYQADTAILNMVKTTFGREIPAEPQQ